MELSCICKNERAFELSYLQEKPFYFDYIKDQNILPKQSDKYLYYVGLYLLFLYFDLIDLCMLPLFVLCSGFSVASSRFSLESWLTILKMYIWLSRLLKTLLLWKSASFQTLLAPDWSGFSRNSLGSELSKIFCSEDIFAFQTLSFFGRWISVFLRWGVVRIAFRLKLFCCSWDAAFWNFIRADRFPVWS